MSTTQVINGEVVERSLAQVQRGGIVRLEAQAWKAAIETMKEVRAFIVSGLTEGQDFGTIPGCGDKNVLFKPGADKTCSAFNVYGDYAIETEEHGNGHKTYRVKANLISRSSGDIVGSGVGCCSTLESKYRYRNAMPTCPKCGVPAVRKKKDGGWWCAKDAGGCQTGGDKTTVPIGGGKIENPDVADVYNTVLKMAKKRAFVDATLSLSCISEHFTQDLEEGHETPQTTPEPSEPQKAPQEPNVAPSEPVFAAPTTFQEHAEKYKLVIDGWVSDSKPTDEAAFRAACRDLWINLCREKSTAKNPVLLDAETYNGHAFEWESRIEAMIQHAKETEEAPA